ncbi:hypothetical protein CEXT_234711 [Caerostris extrusa]|uniref:Uncharacterized protein n=1 Tax=Caerostris extrusa TaxID=172846 RepID=A0AAV4W8Y8_CAEEX|nr:hypothetical protein CEXT_234711 [Caerostris extrusa]
MLQRANRLATTVKCFTKTILLRWVGTRKVGLKRRPLQSDRLLRSTAYYATLDIHHPHLPSQFVRQNSRDRAHTPALDRRLLVDSPHEVLFFPRLKSKSAGDGGYQCFILIVDVPR